MSEAVKRYCMRAFGSIVQPIEVPYSGTWVPSADHDRIVSALRADYEHAINSGEIARAECDTLRAEVERLRKDAERYRLLRDRGATASWEEGGVEVRSHPGMLDAAVDESIDGA